MLPKAKQALTRIGKDDFFCSIMEKLTTDGELEYDEIVYILTCAMLFLRHYQADSRYTSYADIAYYIVLKYSLKYGDYIPLYDFSINFGFYPIARSVLDQHLLISSSLSNCFADIELDRFMRDPSHIETLEQSVESKKFLEDQSLEKSYLAPTSFGKSTLIVEHIKRLEGDLKIAIIVPTKSLLMQTYQMIRAADLKRKLIIHDEMYDGEASVIAVFTQERALRLLRRPNTFFDVLFIDEAHNLLKKDSRSRLLSRLILKNRTLNSEQRVVYLSPLVENVKNLRTVGEQEISSHAIRFNIKEPEIFEYRLDKSVWKYNRFVNQFYRVGGAADEFDYLKRNFGKKNFIYNRRPVRIQLLADALCNALSPIDETDELREIAQILTREVHRQFYGIKCLKYGLIYLHGKMPDLIKEYLEYKYKMLPELKYLIANTVILEGMNLPIDTLFIFNTRSLYGKDLMNLIGRVNRLNIIFTATGAMLEKLLPSVHFVNDELHNGTGSKMTNKITLLRSRVFEDKVENPILEEFQIEKQDPRLRKDEKYKERIKAIQENEAFVRAQPSTEVDQIKRDLIESGIEEFYTDINNLVTYLAARFRAIKEGQEGTWQGMTMMEKIASLFLHDEEVLLDYEVRRLARDEARRYYENHILVAQKKALNENIMSQFKYFQEKAKTSDRKLYVGVAYGEESRESDSYPGYLHKVYVDLASKTDSELINLAIVKLKMEDDFISFKLNKFIVMMYDYGVITKDEYNKYIYGTTDEQKIRLTKYGLSISLISRLDNEGQLQNLFFDEFNNLKGNDAFSAFLDSIDDFYRFEISRYL